MNPPEPADCLLVSELYRSIQGESSFAGRPCVFVRLTGCPLHCAWCDTAYAFQGGRLMGLDEIMSAVAEYKTSLVEVTGGEPLAQAACPALLGRLCEAGYEVLLETSGSIDISPVDPRVVKIMDIKCPGSGQAQANRWENLTRLGPRDELKFVLAGRADYEWARAVVRDYSLGKARPIHFSPVFGALEPAQLARWILEDNLEARLQLQWHKIIWPGETRGV
jgi:7-carboxy-7-deazaguanine synthase